MTTATETTYRLSNGTFTLINRERGTHRTLRVRTQKADARFAPGKRVIALLTGPDNESCYTPFGFVTEEGVFPWRKHQGTVREQLGAILWDLTEQGGQRWGAKVELRESRRCVKCNRKLTEPESIEAGIGPVCRRAK